MDELIRERSCIDQRLTRLEHDARQPRLTMEADGPANTKTRERMEGTATIVQAMHGYSFSAHWVEPGPKINSTRVGMMIESLALSCRENVLVEDGAAAPKSCLPSLEICSPSAAGGLLPAGDTSTATKTTFNKSPLQLYATKQANSKKKKVWTLIPSAWYDSSFWKLLGASSCVRVIETKPMQNRRFDPGGCQGRLRACPYLGS